MIEDPDPEIEFVIENPIQDVKLDVDADSLEKIDKEALSSLPAEMQMEILRNLKTKMKKKFRNQAKEVYFTSPVRVVLHMNNFSSQTPNNFSEIQMTQFLKASHVTKEIKRVSSEFNMDKKRRVASEDQEFIFVKETPKVTEPPKPIEPVQPVPPPSLSNLGDILSPSSFLFSKSSTANTTTTPFSRQSSVSSVSTPSTTTVIDLSPIQQQNCVIDLSLDELDEDEGFVEVTNKKI